MCVTNEPDKNKHGDLLNQEHLIREAGLVVGGDCACCKCGNIAIAFGCLGACKKTDRQCVAE